MDRRTHGFTLFPRGKKGVEIPIFILVIGVAAVCTLAILSFYSSSMKVRDNMVGIGLIEKLNIQIEKNVFYGSETGLVINDTIPIENIFNYARENRVVNRNCKCTTPLICGHYGLFVEEVAEEKDMDKYLLSSLIMQESECVTSAFSGSSVGLMQINFIHCGNYGLPADKDECKKELSENLVVNLETGIAILKEYYNTFKDGLDFRGCNKNTTYYGWEAALRAYNGRGCDPKYPAQDNFVEEVMERAEILRNVGNFEQSDETKRILWWKKETPDFTVSYLGKPGSILG